MAENKQSKNIVVSEAGLSGFADYLKKREGAIAKICASHVSPQRATRVMLACVSRTPALMKCSMCSLAMVMMQSAELGLECGSALGEAYVVPFRNNKTGTMEAQFMPGYRGLICLAYRSGSVLSVQSQVVYDGDEFQFEYGLEPTLRHVPTGSVDAKKITHAYCVIRLRDADAVYDVMTRQEIDRIRARSASSASGPWVTDYAEMAKKTVTRRALKYVPMSIEMSKAIAADVAVETGDFSMLGEFDAPIDVDYEEAPARKTGVSAVKEKVMPTADADSLTDELRAAIIQAIVDLKLSATDRDNLLRGCLGDSKLDDANHDQLIVLRDKIKTM